MRKIVVVLIGSLTLAVFAGLGFALGEHGVSVVEDTRPTLASEVQATAAENSIGTLDKPIAGITLDAGSALTWRDGDVLTTLSKQIDEEAGEITGTKLWFQTNAWGNGETIIINLQKTHASVDLKAGEDANGDLIGGEIEVEQAQNRFSVNAYNGADLWLTSSGRIKFIRHGLAEGVVGEFERDGGLVLGDAEGGSKGFGTINAMAVYDDSSVLTCMALSDEFLKTGTIDVAKWDALVPDTVIPRKVSQEPVTEIVRIEEKKPVKQKDGTYRLETIVSETKRTVTVEKPVFDDKGDKVATVAEPVMKQVVVPEQRVPGIHKTAHLFKQMLDEGFDPRSPAQYFAKLKRDSALPGMPTKQEWSQHALSLGELHSRLWLAAELMAVVLMNHEERITALERKKSDAPVADTESPPAPRVVVARSGAPQDYEDGSRRQ